MKKHYWMGGNRTYEQDRFFEASLDNTRWQTASSPEQWDACWYTGMPDPSLFRKLGPDRTINHIPGNNALTVKSRLHHSLVTLRQRVETQEKVACALSERLEFFPDVFAMPGDYHAFQQAAFDDPSRRWILKPKNGARGKGIQRVRDPATVPAGSSWMVQEYVENPHTMHGRKYVLRLYVAITSVVPLRVYLYRQGFAKLASAPYDEANVDNPYSYLTNPDVNALNLDAEVPVEFVDFDRYRAWLREQGHDDQTLFARIEDMVALTCISALDAMQERSENIGADTRGCYELLGIDCLVDRDLKPWIMECNLSPSLDVCAGPESGGNIEERIKHGLVADLVALAGLNLDPQADSHEHPAQQLVSETGAETARAGQFRRLLPATDPERYLPYYSLPRLEDWLVHQSLVDGPLPQPVLERRFAEDVISEDRVYVYDTRLGRLNTLNETASLIWLMATEGHEPDAIADVLISAASAQADEAQSWDIRRDVWNTLAAWVRDQLLIQSWPAASGLDVLPAKPAVAVPDSRVHRTMRLVCGAAEFELVSDSQPLINRLEPLLQPLITDSFSDHARRLEIVRDDAGFSLILDAQVTRSGLTLARVVPALIGCFLRHAADNGDICLDVVTLARPGQAGRTMVLAGDQDDRAAIDRAAAPGCESNRGVRLSLADRRARELGLPIHSPVRSALTTRPPGPVHQLDDQREVTLTPGTHDPRTASQSIHTLLIHAPDATDDASNGGVLSPIAAMTHLLPRCRGRHGATLTRKEFASLLQWLETLDLRLISSASKKDQSEPTGTSAG